MPLRHLAAAATALLMSMTSAQAITLYGATVGNNATLLTIDTTTGVTGVIGATGYRISGLEMHGGVLYGVTSRNDPSFHGLITLDTATGAGTQVGAGWGASLVDQTGALLAIDSTGAAFTWAEASVDDLTGVNLATGLMTGVVGDSGLGTGAHGMAFDSADNLFLVNYDGATYRIDAGTGGSTFLGNAGVVSHHGTIHPDSGVWWGLANGGGSGTINQIDLSTFVSTPFTLDRSDLHTLAFAGVAPPVPLPAAGGLLILGLAALRGVSRRRG